MLRLPEKFLAGRNLQIFKFSFDLEPKLQEEQSMKKMLLVLGILLLASTAFASTTTYNFVFDGFCDGMSLTLGTPSDISNFSSSVKKVIAGFHDLSACGLGTFVNAGFKHGNPTDYPPFVTPVFDVIDPEGYATITVQYLVQPRPSCVWSNYYSVDGVHNNNFLTGTCTLSGARTRGTGSKSSAPHAVK